MLNGTAGPKVTVSRKHVCSLFLNVHRIEVHINIHQSLYRGVKILDDEYTLKYEHSMA